MSPRGRALRPVAPVERILYTREEAATALGMSVDTYRKTKTAGVYVRHQMRCPAAGEGRCRCQPSYRGHRWDPSRRRMVWSDTFKERAEVLS